MTDFLSKFGNSLESEEYNIENDIEKTLEKDSDKITDNNFIDAETSQNEEITENLEERKNIEPKNSNELVGCNQEFSNCLALTVKKDYSISVVKNIFVRTVKGIWKVAISIFTLNIIKFYIILM